MSTAILLAEVGSTAYGLDIATSDVDEMGVKIEGLADAMGIGKPFEQTVELKPDRTIYSLRKFCRLALQGNPTILTLLFAQPKFASTEGLELQNLAPAFASREAGRRFLGYLVSQRQRLLGEIGQKNVNRPELVAEYGFDTKYAMHMLRLGFQGVEYLTHGSLTLPMREQQRSLLLDVRKGVYTQDACIDMCIGLEEELTKLIDNSPLPPQPQTKIVEEWMLDCYLKAWNTTAVEEADLDYCSRYRV